MSNDEKDWRLGGQERYLQGVILVHRKYRQYPKNLNWDHDHCSFCWATFTMSDIPDAHHQGYATEDDYHWVCEQCFEDFKDIFEWEVIEKL
jgi:hypothetical protein